MECGLDLVELVSFLMSPRRLMRVSPAWHETRTSSRWRSPGSGDKVRGELIDACDHHVLGDFFVCA